MTSDERQKLREAALAAVNGVSERAGVRRAGLEAYWKLQTSNSFRRIGTHFGDGDVLCAITQRSDGHPDLLAAPGVLDYVVAAQPSVVLELLDYADMLESRLARLDEIETQLIKMRTAIDASLKEVFR